MMKPTLAQLEAFFWVARLGSVQKAAGQLNLAQPTVSLRLRDLERVVGQRLFERSGRGLRLDQEAGALLQHASAILGEMEKIRERMGAEEIAGVVRMGVPETFALVGLPALLRTLARIHPALRLELVVATSVELEREVRDHRLDLAFAVNPIGDPGLRMLPLGIQETFWAAAPGWGLGPTVRPVDLRPLPILTNPHPSAMYRQIVDWFGVAGLEPLRLDLCTSVTVIAHLVAAGVAVGFLPRKMIERELEAGSLQTLTGRPAVDPARVYALFRVSDGNARIDAILRITRKVLEEVDFLRPPDG
jgi:DNA-binding transcriptional LysR family regulator